MNFKDTECNPKEVIKVWEGFFKYIIAKTNEFKYVILPEFGTFHNKLFEMTSVEKQLISQCGTTAANIEF